ncbi:hypothetical protein, partial [Streptococcus suis]
MAEYESSYSLILSSIDNSGLDDETIARASSLTLETIIKITSFRLYYSTERSNQTRKEEEMEEYETFSTAVNNYAKEVFEK